MKILLRIATLVFLLPGAVLAHRESEEVARSHGYVLKGGEGEPVLQGEIVIKASPKTGSTRGAMFTQTLAPESRIPLHRHGRVDEFFFVHAGIGKAVLGEKRIAIGPGDVVFVPRGTSHKLENFGSKNPLEVVYFVAEPGLDDFFRDLDARLKEPEPLTLEELNGIATRHGDLYQEW